MPSVRRNRYEEEERRSGERLLRKVGDTLAMQRFLRYAKTSSWYTALIHIHRYFAWLREAEASDNAQGWEAEVAPPRFGLRKPSEDRITRGLD